MTSDKRILAALGMASGGGLGSQQVIESLLALQAEVNAEVKMLGVAISQLEELVKAHFEKLAPPAPPVAMEASPEIPEPEKVEGGGVLFGEPVTVPDEPEPEHYDMEALAEHPVPPVPTWDSPYEPVSKKPKAKAKADKSHKKRKHL